MVEKKVSFSDPDEVLQQKPSISKYLKYLLFFGPGAILASMTIGQGQLIIGPQIGAWAKYGLLWLITISASTYVFCYISTRFTMLSGLSLMDIFSHGTRRGWFNWIVIIIMGVFIPIFTATIITTVGQSLAWIFLGSSQSDFYIAFGIGACLLVVFLLFYFRYRILEHIQAFFVVVLAIGAVISAAYAILNTSGFELLPFLGNFFNFGNAPQYPQWVVDNFPNTTKTPVGLLMLGYVGTLAATVIPMLGYISWVKVKRWGIFRGREHPSAFQTDLFNQYKESKTIKYLPNADGELKKAKKLLIPLKVDITVAYVLIAIVSAAYVICGSLLLGDVGGGVFRLPSGIDLIEEQAVIFTSLASWLKPLFQISVFFAFFGTMYAGFEAASRMLHEAGKYVIPGLKDMEFRRFMAYLVLYVLMLGIPISLLIFKGLDFMLILSITLLFIGVVCVAIYAIAAVYMTQKILPKEYRLGPVGLGIAILSIVMFVGTAIVALI